MITRTLCPALWWLAESLTLRQPERGQRQRWAGALAALAHFSSPEGTFQFCSAQSPGSRTLLVVLDLSLPQLRDTLGAQRLQCPTIQAEKLREKGYVVLGMSWGPSQGRHNCAHQPLGRRCCQVISIRNESLGSTGILLLGGMFQMLMQGLVQRRWAEMCLEAEGREVGLGCVARSSPPREPTGGGCCGAGKWGLA